jgi:broad specificity phosphatase PhoE
MVRTLLTLLLAASGLAADTTVVLLRHAEKVRRSAYAELSDTGRRRAANLPPLLASFQPAALFASSLPRTRQTLEPTARILGIPIQTYARGDEAALAREILVEYPDRTVVVCAHSDTLSTLVSALGAGYLPEIAGFDRYWVVTVPDSGPSVLREHRQPALAGAP